MKILMICEFYDPGLQFQENLLVKYLRKQGHEVRVLTSVFENVFDYYAGQYDPGQGSSRLDDHGAEIFRLPFKYNILNKLRPYKDVSQHLKEFSPDLVFLHDIVPNTPELKRYLDANPACKIIMDVHMDYSNSGKNWLSLKILHGVIRRRFLDLVRPKLEKIFPTSPAAFPFMREIYGVPDREMELLPFGPDVDLIAEVSTDFDRRAARAKLGADDETVLLVTGGKIARRKRVELVLQAMQAPQLDRTELVIIGEFPPEDRDYEKEIRSLAAQLGDRVHFVGWQDPKGTYKHMLMSDIAIFPASQTVMWQQAIGCHLPLVVGDTGGQDPDYLNRHDNMEIVRADDINAAYYQDLISRLVHDPERRQKMAAGAAKTTAEFLDWNQIVKQCIRFAEPAGAAS